VRNRGNPSSAAKTNITTRLVPRVGAQQQKRSTSEVRWFSFLPKNNNDLSTCQ
jgi:hypothetical protein